MIVSTTAAMITFKFSVSICVISSSPLRSSVQRSTYSSSDVDINLFLTSRQTLKPLFEITNSILIIPRSTIIIWESRMNLLFWISYFCREYIGFVEEKDHRGFSEPIGICDGFPQDQGLHHPVRAFCQLLTRYSVGTMRGHIERQKRIWPGREH